MFKIHERVSHFQSTSGDCSSPLSYPIEVIIIVVCCLLGLAWAIYNIFQVEKINVRGGFNGETATNPKHLTSHQENTLLELGDKISEVNVSICRAPKNSWKQNIQSVSSSSSLCSSLSLSWLNKEYGLQLPSWLEQLFQSSVESSEWSSQPEPTTELHTVLMDPSHQPSELPIRLVVLWDSLSFQSVS